MFHIAVSLQGAGAFSRDLTINLTLHSLALKTEKLNARLFPGPRGGGGGGGVDINDWSIIFYFTQANTDTLPCPKNFYKEMNCHPFHTQHSSMGPNNNGCKNKEEFCRSLDNVRTNGTPTFFIQPIQVNSRSAHFAIFFFFL